MNKNLLRIESEVLLSPLTLMALNITGYLALWHEYGHKIMAEMVFNPVTAEVQSDGFDNWMAFIKKPSFSTLHDLLFLKDANNDGFYGGTCPYSYEGLTFLGNYLGEDVSCALFYLGGPLLEELLYISLFAYGLKLKQSRALLSAGILGTALAGYSSLVIYSFFGYDGFANLFKMKSFGDFLNIARITGLNPLFIAVGWSIFSFMPYAGLYLLDKFITKKKEYGEKRKSLHRILTCSGIKWLLDKYPDLEDNELFNLFIKDRPDYLFLDYDNFVKITSKFKKGVLEDYLLNELNDIIELELDWWNNLIEQDLINFVNMSNNHFVFTEELYTGLCERLGDDGCAEWFAEQLNYHGDMKLIKRAIKKFEQGHPVRECFNFLSGN